jgi:hypothetical protein
MKFIIGALLGLFLGWTLAHATVARECRRVGGFYVGKATFKCIEVKDEH